MTTKIEQAYLALHEVLQGMATGSDACPDEVRRNCSVNDLLLSSRTGSVVYLNLLDATGRFLGEEVSSSDDLQSIELMQPATLEIAVLETNDAERDRKLDAIMEALKECFQTLDTTLGGLVDDVAVKEPPGRLVLRGDLAVKAVSVRIEMLLTVPTVFG